MQLCPTRPTPLTLTPPLRPTQRCRARQKEAAKGVDSRYLPDVPPPWALTFDIRERETLWTDQNKARLVQFIASDRMDISREEMEQRVKELSVLLPDLVSRYSSMDPDLLAAILESIDRVALHVIEMKKAFPNTNISVLIARNPNLLLQEIPEILAQAQQTMELLELDEVDGLIEQYPLFLDASAVEEVLDELQRLMPGNAKSHLIKNPALILSTVRGRKRLGEPADT